jgi:hypothetical protein
VDCRPFFSRRTRLDRALAALCWLAAAGVSGCATVKPQDKELLADPAMIYGSGGATPHRQEEHVLENREGATTGNAAGGGCGCN